MPGGTTAKTSLQLVELVHGFASVGDIVHQDLALLRKTVAKSSIGSPLSDEGLSERFLQPRGRATFGEREIPVSSSLNILRTAGISAR